jgi:TDG/mug DNA glycosylase family protein
MPTSAQLQAFRGHTLPDLLGSDVRLLFVGINPGLFTAAVQAHFARRGNRFYPALFRAGIVDRMIDASHGYDVGDVEHLKARGVGITNLVPGATARADEVSRAELVAGARTLAELVRAIQPRVVAVLGITAYRIAFEKPKAVVGLQAAKLAGAQLWVVSNPSGLNAHATPTSLAVTYREIAVAAGIDTYDVPASD